MDWKAAPGLKVVLAGMLVVLSQVGLLGGWAQMPTPRAEATVTPIPPISGRMRVDGTAWTDAAPAPAGTVVQALVGDVICGESAVVANSWLPLLFSLDVAPVQQKPGCGKDNVTVSFTIGGRPARETLAWNADAAEGGDSMFIDLSAGAPFAAYGGPMAIQGRPVTEYLIDGKPLADPIIVDASVVTHVGADEVWNKCGELVVGQAGLSTAIPSEYYYLVVPSDATVPGCGREGAEVVFRIAGAVIARTTWMPGFHQFPLETDGPIIRVSPNPPPGLEAGPIVPSLGTGDVRETARWTPWQLLGGSALLALLGAAALRMSAYASRRRRA